MDFCVVSVYGTEMSEESITGQQKKVNVQREQRPLWSGINMIIHKQERLMV